MRAYIVTMIHGSERTVRRVIALDSVQATIIGLCLMPETGLPLSIFCKPQELTA